jgi:heme exporter protein C
MATLSASAPAHAGTRGRPRSAQLIETVLVAVLLGIAGYSALFVAPTEATMGVIQRIFYFHVPSWWSAFVAFAIVLVSNLAYLRGRNPKWDWLGVSAAEVGVAFVTVGLVTGPIWAHPVWGIWWTWDARLTSAFVLWVLYVSYLLLRNLIEEPERRAVISAVFGIFAAVDIPLVYFSIWFFRTQHPQPVIGDGGSLDPTMGKVLLLCWAAMLGVMVLLVRQRYRVEALRWDVDRLRLEGAQRTNGSATRQG